uniref:Leucine rich repeat containing 66 n=1 Tax=Equus caballus TaxID=9796 RepID=A0A3Q2HSG1_HORSE|nr:leucine-rich repeat-containing protein 66 [Equus caballus]XP_023493869.1 leucine-rich repeat-containing protein 66 [Equus caballus]
MKNPCFRIVTIVVGLYVTQTMTNSSRKSNILFNSKCQWNGYLLTNCSFTQKHEIPVDISQTAATVDASSSFFRALLQSHTKKEEWNIKHLDLSNNLISKITLSPLAPVHALETLNLSNNAICSISLDLPSLRSSWVKRHRGGFRNGLPFLKLLILQRNKLSDIPKGLWKLKSLQSLDLSFNKISQIGSSDFHNCLRLENLNLQSNRIFRIHPEAFKDLKKLQVVDLSNNALTTILPMMIIALEFPHLEVDLADNQWECDYNVAVFQNFISESWRKKWNEICNKSIGNEKVYWWTPKRRISRETHLPHTESNPMRSLVMSKTERPREGQYTHFSPLGRKDDAMQRQLPRRVRRDGDDVQTPDRKQDASQDLALAVCLAVFITFFVAFCLGAFARPYVDRLWQQRCRKKGPGSDTAYSNEGFCDDVEAAENTQHPRVGQHQPCCDLKLYENQDSFLVTGASPHAAIIPDRTLNTSRKEPDSRQSREQLDDNNGAGSSKDYMLPSDSAAGALLRGQPNADQNARSSAAQDHIYSNAILGEINYETVAQEDPLSELSVGVPAVVGRSQTVSSSIHNDSSELDPPLLRETTASLSQMLTHPKAQRTGEHEGRGVTEQLPSEFSKEMQASTYVNLLSAQQQRLKGSSAEEELSTYYSAVTLSDPEDTDPSPPVFPPGWGRDLHVTPANKEPGQEHPPDTQYELDTDYDSDEGSLFTLSSISSEDARNMTEEEAHGEESRRASEAPEDQDSGMSKDNVMSLESLDNDITFQKVLGKCENQEDHFEKPLTSGPDSGWHETHLESGSNTNKFEDPLTLPESLGNSPFTDETPEEFSHDWVTALQPEVVEWLYSLKDLEFSYVDILPQTPPRSDEVPSDPSKSACRERDSNTCKDEPFIQETDTARNHSPFKITTGENLRPSQQDFEEANVNSNLMETDANERFVCPPEDHDSRRVISQTQLFQFCGDESAVQCERGGGEYFEDGSKSQVPLLPELANDASSLRSQEPFSDRDWGKYSQENLLQSEKDDSDLYPQMQTQSNSMGADNLLEDQCYYDEDKDVQLESQREFK